MNEVTANKWSDEEHRKKKTNSQLGNNTTSSCDGQQFCEQHNVVFACISHLFRFKEFLTVFVCVYDSF